MALLKQIGFTGSAASSFLLAALLFRSVAVNPGPPTDNGKRKDHPPATNTSTSAAGRNSKSQKGKWPEEGPWQASRQYFVGHQGVNPDTCPPLKADSGTKSIVSLNGVNLKLLGSDEGNAIGDERSHLWCIPSDEKVAAMIATVPDTVHSHLSLIFDRTIEALQLSGESMGYEMDRYWLPWQPQTPGSGSIQSNVEDNSEKEKQPGLLMFRWNGSMNGTAPNVFFIFLVAENSTSGINGAQFSNAVQYVQQVCGQSKKWAVGCGLEKDSIAIMGPSFSGSLSSLRQLIQPLSPQKKTEARKDRPYFNAFSGTLSSVCALETQGLIAQNYTQEELSRLCPEPRTSAPADHLTVQSMMVDSETIVQKFILALQEKNSIQCDGNDFQVAIFSEAATTYGSAVKTPSNCYSIFRYPREISSLRNASAASDAPIQNSQQASAIDSSAYLPFTLADQQPNSGDEAPDFSQTQGPLSKEAVLMKYAADLRRGHYKFAGIIGTNIVDVLYLAKFLRQACPDVRLFILYSDLLFERDLENAPYIGMVSVGTYPLIGRNLHWTGSDNSPYLPFSDQYEEGQYNASIRAMRIALSSSNGTLMEVGKANGDCANTQPNILPIWLTIVGTGGYWPIQIIRQPPGYMGGNLSLQSVDFSASWWVVTLVLTIIACFQSWVLITVKPDAFSFRDLSLMNPALPQRFFFINVISVSLAFMLAIFISPALKYSPFELSYVWGMLCLGLLAIFGLFVVCCRLGLYFRNFMSGKQQEIRCYLVSLFSSVLLWVLAGIGLLLWCNYLLNDEETHYGFFFSYRSVNPATGVSPITPLLLVFLAIYLWGIFEIWRLRFDDDVRPQLNLHSGLPGNEEETPIASSVNKFFLNKNYRVAFGLVYVTWIVALHPWSPFNLIEKRIFGVLYEIALFLVVAFILGSGMRLSQTWGYLHRLLLKLERSNIRTAFSRLKGTGWSSIWTAGGQEEEWVNIARSMEVLESIPNGGQAQSEDLKKNIQSVNDIRKDIHACNAAEKKDFARLESLFTQLQSALASVLGNIMDLLPGNDPSLLESEDFDKKEPPVIMNCCKEEPDANFKILQRMQEYAALRYVAFIRSTVAHIRRWLILQVIVFCLVLLSLNVYSFEPHRSLAWAFSIIFVLIGAAAVRFLMQIERNPIISRITATTPNELGLSFYIRLATLGIAPLLTLLATHFPSIGHYLLSFLQPGMEALK